MDCFLYDRELCRETVNTLLLVCIHQDIFLEYDKMINIYVPKYPKKMLLINRLCGNLTVYARNACKACLDFIYSHI